MSEEIQRALEELRRQIRDHEERIKTLEEQITKALQPSPSGEEKRLKRDLSINEFFRSKKPQTEADKVLVIAYYIEIYEGRSPFTTRDVREAFRRAREALPKNLSDCIARNVKKGYIKEVDRKKKIIKWALTKSGKEYVENIGKEKEDG